MRTTTTQGAKGRPVDLEKRGQIVEYAGSLFLERGLDAVSIEAVAEAAGVSKVTVYNHFGDKAGLFAAVIRSRSERMRQALETIDITTADPERTLVAFGRELLGFLSRPEVVAMERLLIGQGHRHPELTRAYFAAGPRTVCDQLAAMLARWMENGQLEPADPDRAARKLVGLWKGMDHMEVMLGLRPFPSDDDIETRIRDSVVFFLRAAGKGSGRPESTVTD